MFKTDEETGKIIISNEKEKKVLSEDDGVRAEIIMVLLVGFSVVMVINLFDKDTLLSQLMNKFGFFRFFLFLIPIWGAVQVFKNTFTVDEESFAAVTSSRSAKNEDKGRTLFDIPIGVDLADEKKKTFFYDFREGHTLIGGVTRYGKSVLLNTLVYGIMKISPHRVRLVIVDFKGVDFALFERLPHLMTKTIISDKNQFKSVLEWLVDESDERFKKIRNSQVRNIRGYNQMSKMKMAYIFVIVDEYLKMLSYFSVDEKKEVVKNLNALISTSAGCGIILFLTTQRPDAQILDGSIKANLSNRIAFHCADEKNSKIILDEAGAEKLMQKGEMLFKNDFGTKHLKGLIFGDKEIINQINDISCKYPQIFKKINLQSSPELEIRPKLELRAKLRPDPKPEPEQENNLITFKPKEANENNKKLFKSEFMEKIILKVFEDKKTVLSRTYLKKILGVGDKKADEVLNELKEMNFISNDDEKRILVPLDEIRNYIN